MSVFQTSKYHMYYIYYLKLRLIDCLNSPRGADNLYNLVIPVILALCGNGCIRVRQEVLLQRMSLADITTVDIHFKEHTMYPKNQHEYRNEQFEIWHMDHSIVNDRPMFSEHEIKKFFIESWNFYKKGWRGTQVTTFMKEWFTHNLNESVRFFKMRKTVDEDVSNFRFAYVDQVKPVIVLGGSPTRARTARSIDQSAEEYVSETPACPAALTGQTKCCRLSTTLTNEMMGPQYSFVETTTERNLTVCGGTCGECNVPP